MRFLPFLSLTLLPALLSLLVLAAPAVADSGSDSAGSRSMTGTWLTRTPSPFVLQDPDGFAPGVAGPIKEFTLMRWELEEDQHGRITGYNTYFSLDDAGESRSRGTLCMVGARVGSRVILSEAYAVYDGYPVPEASTIAIFNFDCEQKGRKKIECIGNGLSNIQPTALQATLKRSKRPGEVIPVPEAAREVCQPGS